MIQSCPTHQLQWNDQTVKACPLCNEVTLLQIRQRTNGVMGHKCGVCGREFDNQPKWWTQHGNICPDCTHQKLSPKIAKAKAPKKAVIKGKIAEAFVELYNKPPNALDIEQFRGFYRQKRKVEVLDEDEE